MDTATAAVFVSAALALTLAARQRNAAIASRTHSLDPAAAERKLAAIAAGGPSLLHVVVDWDRTVTTYRHAGRPGHTCHGIVEARRSPALRAQATALNSFYLPIETSTTLSREEKIPHMAAWYASVNALLVAERITREDLEGDVRAANLGLRAGVAALLRASAAHGFPVTILSAGIGDVIAEVLRQRCGPLPANLRIASNAMLWEGGACAGFSQPTLHMYNKAAAFAFAPEELARLRRERPHVVLVGDSDGDATMAEGLEPAVLLRIGIANDAAALPAVLPKFLKSAWLRALLRKRDRAHPPFFSSPRSV